MKTLITLLAFALPAFAQADPIPWDSNFGQPHWNPPAGAAPIVMPQSTSPSPRTVIDLNTGKSTMIIPLVTPSGGSGTYIYLDAATGKTHTLYQFGGSRR